jgi:hypothetical protein
VISFRKAIQGFCKLLAVDRLCARDDDAVVELKLLGSTLSTSALVERAMEQPGLHERHRDKDGEISRKHGNTLVGTLRKTYGQSFASGCSEQETLSEVLHKLDEDSLSQLIRDHEAGWLQEICRK